MRRARAYWATGPYRGEIREEPIGAPGPDEVLVQTRYSGVSRGTEAIVAAGGVPASEHERMRCPFQAGAFPFPVKYGYASVGEVIGGASSLLGRQVFCLFPHQDLYVVPAAAVQPLPDGLPPGRAVLAANMETALNGIWDAGAAPGDRIAVIGAGVVGLLVAWLASRLPGCEVVVVERDATRLPAIEALGLIAGNCADADIAINCSGSGEGLAQALDLVGQEGLVLEMSWHGASQVTLPLGCSFHSRRLTLKSSQVGQLPPPRRPRWDHARRLAMALDLLRMDDRLDGLVTGESMLDELPQALPALAQGSMRALCQRVRYDG